MRRSIARTLGLAVLVGGLSALPADGASHEKEVDATARPEGSRGEKPAPPVREGSGGDEEAEAAKDTGEKAPAPAPREGS